MPPGWCRRPGDGSERAGLASCERDTANVREASDWTARTFRGSPPPPVSPHPSDPTDEEGRRGRVQGTLRIEVKKVQCKTITVGTYLTLLCSLRSKVGSKAGKVRTNTPHSWAGTWIFRVWLRYLLSSQLTYCFRYLRCRKGPSLGDTLARRAGLKSDD